MAVQLNHTIVLTDDRHATADFITEILGLAPARSFADEFFLFSEDEFDQIFGRLQERGVRCYADHLNQVPGEINHLLALKAKGQLS
ncbi:hypothetical protein ACFWNN_40675 [Lentzea sp. NPDC058450]|uniref:hypothetical protein n=1 Tax=Lentzea sp. NPDC058450 TaxID=3346505 RepID=UPI003656D41D